MGETRKNKRLRGLHHRLCERPQHNPATLGRWKTWRAMAQDLERLPGFEQLCSGTGYTLQSDAPELGPESYYVARAGQRHRLDGGFFMNGVARSRITDLAKALGLERTRAAKMYRRERAVNHTISGSIVDWDAPAANMRAYRKKQ